MLLKLGIALMSAALLLAVAAGAITFTLREKPELDVASKSVAKTGKPDLTYGETQRTPPEKKDSGPRVKADEVGLKSEPKPQPGTRPEPDPKVQTVAGTDWPESSASEIEAASNPRHYQLPDGAILGLTIKAIGIYDAPVFDSYSQWAFTNGVAHQPETSLPWSATPQRNVYLAGHRLGYPGTGSHLIFYNLDKLRPGDEVLLKNQNGKSYTYRVSDAFVVDPGESWVMGQIRGRDMLTLQTCTGPGYTQRLIVRADRV